eukprot:Lithocolla_globosa_v1_NODE_1439_length_2574_cov_13.629218.p4 type:complete len:117 gc:universal NODE_1439_length_2574_cov_13.629218:1536-1186(-)
MISPTSVEKPFRQGVSWRITRTRSPVHCDFPGADPVRSIGFRIVASLAGSTTTNGAFCGRVGVSPWAFGWSSCNLARISGVNSGSPGLSSAWHALLKWPSCACLIALRIAARSGSS